MMHKKSKFEYEMHNSSLPNAYTLAEKITYVYLWPSYLPTNTYAYRHSTVSSVCSAAQSCLTVCHPMDWSTQGFPVHHQHCESCPNSCPSSRLCRAIIYSSSIPFSCLQSFPASGSIPMSQFFTSGDQSIGASALASVLSMNIQDCFL